MLERSRNQNPLQKSVSSGLPPRQPGIISQQKSPIFSSAHNSASSQNNFDTAESKSSQRRRTRYFKKLGAVVDETEEASLQRSYSMLKFRKDTRLTESHLLRPAPSPTKITHHQKISILHKQREMLKQYLLSKVEAKHPKVQEKESPRPIASIAPKIYIPKQQEQTHGLPRVNTPTSAQAALGRSRTLTQMNQSSKF